MSTLLRLAWEFFKAGLFAIGGGLATLPFLYDISRRTGWFTTRDITDMIAVSESTPGPLGVNMSTYVGFHTAGVAGAVSASLALVLPSFIIILIISNFLKKYKENRAVQNAMYGIRPASVAMITYACLLVARAALLNTELFAVTGALTDLISWKAILLGIAVLASYLKFKKHPIVYILGAAVIGIVFRF
ncbi:MAG: chromate transporter [Lachnospiraceae bacterium]|nr:chromate transporter [Lachnospiraceae bacterium]